MEFKLNTTQIKDIIDFAIKEDIGEGDITTNSIIPSDLNIAGDFIAKEDGIIAGLPIAELIFAEYGKNVCFEPLVKEGTKVTNGDFIAKIKGNARMVLAYERLSLNFLQRLSGIATLTSMFSQKVEKYEIKIVDTRKTTPGWRYLEKYAVKIGGGENHRMGLYDQVLIKDNHLSILNNTANYAENKGSKKQDYSITDVILSVRQQIPNDMLIEVEVDTIDKIEETLKSNVDILMFDNMNSNQIDAALEIVNNWRSKTKEKGPLIEVSGGVTIENIAEIAKQGIDRIAIGAITHSAKALDISLEIS